MSIFRKRGAAWVVLALAIAAAVALGQLRRPANAGYQKYIDDRAGLLSAATEQTIRDCNARWDEKYGACVAVATLPDDPNMALEDYGYDWGDSIGLGDSDMALVLTAAGNWTVCLGDNAYDSMTDKWQSRLTAAVNGGENEDAAVRRFLNAADDFYSGGLRRSGAVSAARRGAFPLGRVLLLLAAVLVIWLIVDRIRYRRYLRRAVSAGPGGVRPVYYPVFWGRRAAAPRTPGAPKRPAGRPSRPAGSVRPSDGTTRPSGGIKRPAGGSIRPSSQSVRPPKTYRPSGGSFSSHSFGSSSRGSFSGASRSSSTRSSASRSFGSRSGGSFSGRSGGHSFGGSRGGGRGSFGGKR